MASHRKPPWDASATESEPRSEDAVKRAEHEPVRPHSAQGSSDLFERLRRDGVRWSRNRNFELYESPGALRTLRRVLWLRQLERDLVLASAIHVRLGGLADRGDTFHLEIELPSLHLRRSVYLTRAELAALREGPAGAHLPPEDADSVANR